MTFNYSFEQFTHPSFHAISVAILHLHICLAILQSFHVPPGNCSSNLVGNHQDVVGAWTFSSFCSFIMQFLYSICVFWSVIFHPCVIHGILDNSNQILMKHREWCISQVHFIYHVSWHRITSYCMYCMFLKLATPLATTHRTTPFFLVLNHSCG